MHSEINFWRRLVYASVLLAPLTSLAEPPLWVSNPNAATVVGTVPPCGSSPVDEIACSAVTDNFCAELWNKKNLGSLTRGEDKLQTINLDTLLPQATQAHFEALMRAKSSFPPDLLTKARPSLDQMAELVAIKIDRAHLSPEEKGRLAVNQMEKATKMLNGFHDAIDEAGYDRLVQQSGSLENARKRIIENPEYAQSFSSDLSDEVTHKIYDHDRNWLRVTHLVENIRSRAVEQISASALSDNMKQRLIAKLKSVQAVLPSANPRKFQGENGCATTTVNASYDPQSNKLTVCAGLFNTYQSADLLYLVLAHEFYHSIDPRTVAIEDFQNSRLGRAFSQVEKNNWSQGPIACDRWKEIKADLIDSSDQLPFTPGPLFDVSNCLVDRTKLPEATSTLLDQAAKDSADVAVQFWNDNRQFFASLSDSSNKARYLRPDNLKASFPRSDLLMMGEFYVQEIACNSAGKASPEAEAQAARLAKAYYRAQFAYTLREDGEAGKYGVPSFENFSDMMATRLIPEQIRQKDLSARRQSLGFMTATFCPMPTGFNPDRSPIFPADPAGAGNSIQDSHDTGTHRRHSFFGKDIATMLHCRPDALTQNAAADRCKL